MMPNHVALLLSIPPKIGISSFVEFLKGKSAMMIFDKDANLEYKYRNCHFGSEGNYVSTVGFTVGFNEATNKKYMQKQDKHDMSLDKLSVREYEDPFKG